MTVQAEWQALLGVTGTVWFFDGVSGDNDADGLTPDTAKADPLHGSVTFADNQGIVIWDDVVMGATLNLGARTGMVLTSRMNGASGVLSSAGVVIPLFMNRGRLVDIEIDSANVGVFALAGAGELRFEDSDITSQTYNAIGCGSMPSAFTLRVHRCSLTAKEYGIGIQGTAGVLLEVLNTDITATDYDICNQAAVFIDSPNMNVVIKGGAFDISNGLLATDPPGADDIAGLCGKAKSWSVSGTTFNIRNTAAGNAKDVYGIKADGIAKLSHVTIATANPNGDGDHYTFAPYGAGLSVVNLGGNTWDVERVADGATVSSPSGGLVGTSRLRGRARARIVGTDGFPIGAPPAPPAPPYDGPEGMVLSSDNSTLLFFDWSANEGVFLGPDDKMVSFADGANRLFDDGTELAEGPDTAEWPIGLYDGTGLGGTNYHAYEYLATSILVSDLAGEDVNGTYVWNGATKRFERTFYHIYVLNGRWTWGIQGAANLFEQSSAYTALGAAWRSVQNQEASAAVFAWILD